MAFTAKQVGLLRRDVKTTHVRTRTVRGRELSYVEGHFALSEANRIFGFDSWDRETIETRCVLSREVKGSFLAVYVVKVRVSVRADGQTIVREAHGCGEARGNSAGEVHELALKTSETDATKRALATFGKSFGLSLYKNVKNTHPKPENSTESAQHLEKKTRAEFHKQGRVDKSVLTFSTAKRIRDRAHLRFVAAQPCLLCSKEPSDPHHLRFAQPSALGMKVSDEFTVPLCREHHRQLHHSGNELAWWHDMGIEPGEIAKDLWKETCAKRQQNKNDGSRTANFN